MTIKGNPRRDAAEIVDRVERERAFAEPLLDRRLSTDPYGRPEDGRLLTELVYGTLRMRNRLDWIIGTFFKGDIQSMEGGIRNIIRVALYQLFCMDRIPSYAAVNEAVQFTKGRYPGREGLVNALLRNAVRRRQEITYPDFSSRPLECIASYHSHPHWLVAKWSAYFGLEETKALCMANNRIPPLAVRLNPLKTDRAGLLAEFSKEGFLARESSYSPHGIIIDHHPYPVQEHPSFVRGHFQFQDEASQLISVLLDPQAGEAVLDMCSGSGIKATHIASMMRNRGIIVAVDKNAAKLKKGAELARRLGVDIIERIAADADRDLGESFYRRFDRILVDAPCTGLGTVRRKPEIKWCARPGDSTEHARRQGGILRHCAGYLKKGGTLVYATCTTEPEENECVVEELLSRDPSLVRCNPPASVDALMTDSEGFFRTFPHRHNTDGFFGAVLKKTT